MNHNMSRFLIFILYLVAGVGCSDFSLQPSTPGPVRTPISATGTQDEQWEAYLTRHTEIESGSTINFIDINENQIVFVAQSAGIPLLQRGVLDISGQDIALLSFENYPPDHGTCALSDTPYPVELVEDHLPFVVMNCVPVTGTCVAIETMHIDAIDEQGTFIEVWSGMVLSAQGVYQIDDAGNRHSVSEVSAINFDDLNGDGDLEIIRETQLISCGSDNCICTTGQTEEILSLQIFRWDSEKAVFVEND